jgi:hypothetical protein
MPRSRMAELFLHPTFLCHSAKFKHRHNVAASHLAVTLNSLPSKCLLIWKHWQGKSPPFPLTAVGYQMWEPPTKRVSFIRQSYGDLSASRARSNGSWRCWARRSLDSWQIAIRPANERNPLCGRFSHNPRADICSFSAYNTTLYHNSVECVNYYSWKYSGAF